ncbi:MULTISPECIES: hypothetical protein [Sphingobacterium]|uniref:Uncharacterized protein n=1 Tax=Sphingobacterium tenebrionis TaxID=3111775 RepID=A0ABU8I4Q7_9SPHI|nr:MULTISPECIES: hypothetical protein [unclassified Sphingobacterium]QBR11373.1 hypothetical protein E3D81_03935 [Sphingobacterium sp. CZ-2]
MKYILSIGLMMCSLIGFSQTTEHITKLELGKKEKKTFSKGDSTMVIKIDTLIMKDKARLDFFAKKDVKLEIGYAEIGNNVVITGTDSKNNATNFDISSNFQQLGSLFIIARGFDAFNGTRTFPNGNGGKVTLAYNDKGIVPQTKEKNKKNYVFVDVQPGGLSVNPSSEIRQIYSRIAMSPGGLRGLPQGQIYSGSPGMEGKVEIKPMN